MPSWLRKLGGGGGKGRMKGGGAHLLSLLRQTELEWILVSCLEYETTEEGPETQ